MTAIELINVSKVYRRYGGRHFATLKSAPSPSASPTTAPSPSASPSPSPSPSSSPGIGHGTSPSDLVLRIATAGGFINPQTQLFALPEFAVYGDVTVLAPDFSGTSPNPAIAQLIVTKISEAGLQALLTAAANAGLLGKNAHYDSGPMPDAGTTTFTLTADGRTHTVSVVGLGHQGGDPSTQDARDKLAAFDTALQDIPTLVGPSNVVAPAATWTPSGLLVFAQAADSTGGATAAWPLSTPLSQFGDEIRSGDSGGSGGGGLNPGAGGALRCGIVTGSDLATLSHAVAAATPDTIWTSDGATWSLTVRPQLPDETACPGT